MADLSLLNFVQNKLFFPLFFSSSSNLRSSGGSHIGSLFTNGEKKEKKTGS